MQDTGTAEERERPLSEPPPRISDVRLGRYRLAFELASGGMATLYLAVAEGSGGFGKVLALKRIHPHLAKESDFREMFLDEARVASLLHHPNVCGVLDYGEEDGLPYFTMEYILGEPLSRVQRVLRRMDDVPQRERSRFAARIIADAAHGLHAAHELRDPEGNHVDLVHRDVSPQNLIVTYDGVTRVLDFGIARTRVQEHHTATGTIKGKFAYMAPEQLLGEDVDRRADIWALGVVLWETLTGSRLFKRKTEMETLLAVTQGTIADAASVDPDLDPDLSAIVSRALQRDLDARYDTAEDMARDLERYLVKDQQIYGAPEVSARMRELFPAGHERKRQLIADALAKRPGPVPRGLHTESTSVSVEDISVVVNAREAPSRRNGAWIVGGLAVALAAAVVVQLYWRPFAVPAPEPSAARAEQAEHDLVPLQHAPTTSASGAEGVEPAEDVRAAAALPPAPAEAAPVETPTEVADHTAHSRRRRRPRPAPASPAATGEPARSPAPNSAPAPPQPEGDGPRRPVLVESLDMAPAAPAQTESSSSERRSPLVVEELDL